MGALYKKGDKVKIREDLESLSGKIHFYVSRNMIKMAGKAYTISDVTEKSYPPSNPLEDGCLYWLEGDSGFYSWPSEAFIPTKPFFKVGDTVMVRKDLTAYRDYSRIPFSVNDDMLKHAGKVGTIVRASDYYPACVGLDGYGYELDIDRRFFGWSNEDLVKAESAIPILNKGDKVTIRPDLEETVSSEIQYGVNDEMVEYAGRVCTIKRVDRGDYEITKPGEDGCRYKIEEDEGFYSWSSEMFVFNNLKTKQNEIKLQGKEVAVSRGNGYTGSIVRSGRCKAAVTVGHLGHKAVTGD